MRTRRSANERRGTALYVTVLSTSLIVSVLGLAGLTLVKIERREMATGDDRRLARLNANSAVELALRVIDNDPDWRTTYTSGVETTPQTLGPDSAARSVGSSRTRTLSLADADTDLRVVGIGRVGNVVQVSSVAMTAGGLSLNCLEVAVCSGGLIEFETSSISTTNQIVHSNTDINCMASATVNSNAEATGQIFGTGYTAMTNAPVPSRDFPGSTVFDYYLANGTPINYSSLVKAGPTRALRDVVLSPSSNPYGPTNPEGIYVIDCQGSNIKIEYCRIIGTLVLINPDPLSDIQFEMSMEPAVSNYPALLVQGSIALGMQNTVLSEAGRGVNFNPAGSPYQGLSDNDQLDTYPSQVKGLVYVSGLVHVRDNHPRIDGVLVCGQLNVNTSDQLTVTYDPSYMANPPPGFFVRQPDTAHTNQLAVGRRTLAKAASASR